MSETSYLTNKYAAYKSGEELWAVWTLDAPADDDGPEIRGEFLGHAHSMKGATEWVNNLQMAYDTPCMDVVGKSPMQLKAEEKNKRERLNRASPQARGKAKRKAAADE